jgi:hypothetical protein
MVHFLSVLYYLKKSRLYITNKNKKRASHFKLALLSKGGLMENKKTILIIQPTFGSDTA